MEGMEHMEHMGCLSGHDAAPRDLPVGILRATAACRSCRQLGHAGAASLHPAVSLWAGGCNRWKAAGGGALRHRCSLSVAVEHGTISTVTSQSSRASFSLALIAATF
jgi:hypothetical protein